MRSWSSLSLYSGRRRKTITKKGLNKPMQIVISIILKMTREWQGVGGNTLDREVNEGISKEVTFE